MSANKCYSCLVRDCTAKVGDPYTMQIDRIAPNSFVKECDRRKKLDAIAKRGGGARIGVEKNSRC